MSLIRIRKPSATAAAGRSTAKRFIFFAFVAALVLTLCQLALGGDPVIVLVALLTQGVCLIPVYVYGMDKTSGFLFVIVWATFSFFAFAVKTILLQPIDSYLYNPLLTHLVLLVGASAYVGGALAARWIGFGKGNHIKPTLDPSVLTVAAVVFEVIGLLGWVGSKADAANGNVWGELLYPCLFFAFACATAAAMIRSGGRRTFSLLSLLMAVAPSWSGFMVGSKQGMLMCPAAYVLCMVAFGVRFNWVKMTALTAAAAFSIAYLFPATYIARGEKAALTPIELPGQIAEVTIDLMMGDKNTIDQLDRATSANFANSGTYDSIRNIYFGGQSIILDRFTLTGFADAMLRRTNFDGPFLGSAFVLNQTVDLLPRQLNPDKSVTARLAPGDKIAQAYGMEEAGSAGTFPTVPMSSELFDAGGFPDIIIIGVPLIFLWVWGYNLMAYELRNNIWAVCVLMGSAFTFYTSSYSGILFILIRILPVSFLLMKGGLLVAEAIAKSPIFHRARVARAPTLAQPRAAE